VAEVLEAPHRLTRDFVLVSHDIHFGLQDLLQPLVAGQAEDVVDACGLAPRHQRVPREAGVGTQDDPHRRPAPTDLGRDTLHLLQRSRRPVDVRGAQPRRQQEVVAEDVQRQVAVAAVVPVEEAPLLLAVQRVVGRV
jgi:hypothetical protein